MADRTPDVTAPLGTDVMKDLLALFFNLTDISPKGD
jgi:hypothetical protein